MQRVIYWFWTFVIVDWTAVNIGARHKSVNLFAATVTVAVPPSLHAGKDGVPVGWIYAELHFSVQRKRNALLKFREIFTHLQQV